MENALYLLLTPETAVKYITGIKYEEPYEKEAALWTMKPC